MSAPPNSTTVILIHGLGRSAASMRLLQYRLERAGFRAETVRYPSRSLAFEEALEEVCTRIAEIAAGTGGPLHLVGHSLGGVIALAVKRRGAVPRIHRVVQLGSPNRGSAMAALLREWRLARRYFGPVLSDLAEDRGGRWRRDPDVLAIAATDVPSALSRLYGIAGPNDGLVGLRSAWGRAAGHRAVAGGFHGWLPVSATVAAQVIRFLKTGRTETDE